MTSVAIRRLPTRRAWSTHSAPDRACAVTTPKRNLRVDMSTPFICTRDVCCATRDGLRRGRLSQRSVSARLRTFGGGGRFIDIAGEMTMAEPLTLALVGSVILSEGVKFLYAQAGDALKRWRPRKEARTTDSAAA